MGVGFFLVQVMTVVGRQQLDTKFLAETNEALVDRLLFLDTVFLEFKVVTVTEQLLHLDGLFSSLIVSIMRNEPGNLSVQAGAQS